MSANLWLNPLKVKVVRGQNSNHNVSTPNPTQACTDERIMVKEKGQAVVAGNQKALRFASLRLSDSGKGGWQKCILAIASRHHHITYRSNGTPLRGAL